MRSSKNPRDDFAESVSNPSKIVKNSFAPVTMLCVLYICEGALHFVRKVLIYLVGHQQNQNQWNQSLESISGINQWNLQSVCNDSTDWFHTDCSHHWNQSVESAIISGINQWNRSVESISGINQWNRSVESISHHKLDSIDLDQNVLKNSEGAVY